MYEQVSKSRRNVTRKSAGNEIAAYLRQNEFEEAAEVVDHWVERWAEE